MGVLSGVLYVVCTALALLVDVLWFALFLRAILSWFPPNSKENVIRNFVYTVTEFFIAPVRAFLDRFDWVRRTPLDISFLVTYILLSLLSTFFSLL